MEGGGISVTLKSKQGDEYHGSLKNGGQVKRHAERRKLVCVCRSEMASVCDKGGEKKGVFVYICAPVDHQYSATWGQVNYIRAKLVGDTPPQRQG